MSYNFDLVIRGGAIADGSGQAIFEADVAVKSGRIAAVGSVSGRGAEEIDATGKLVTPGFVDIHTHYDGQATWDSRLQPSSWHGVTTVVMGNCGVGFAPCRPDDHARLIRLMEGVEDIPYPVLSEGLDWDWESFPEYLDALDRRRFDVDIGAQLPHAALRVYVMGERGAAREEATPKDVVEMSRLAREAVEAGALGFSTSRTLNHRTSDGQPTPTLTASEAELVGIADGLAGAGRGVLQFVSDFQDPVGEVGMLRRLAAESGRPLSFSLTQGMGDPARHRRFLDLLTAANAEGLEMRGQVAGRAIGVLLGFELTLNPFSHHPTYAALAGVPLNERVAALRDPEVRARLLVEEESATRGFLRGRPREWDRMYLMEAVPDYEPTAENTVAAIAKLEGRAPAEVALDQLLAQEGRGMLYLPFANYAEGHLDACGEMLSHPNCVPGLSDGGAHVGTICDASFPTFNLTHWTRDRTRGPRLPLEHMVKAQTRDTARAVELFDRGLVAPGYRADLNVIDYANLKLLSPEVAYDLPAGGRRLLQRARGYVATIVAGEITYRDGEATGALPGRLVRGRQIGPGSGVR